MPEQLAIVGASARAAAFSALRAGLKPYAGDLFADADLATVCPAVRVNHYPQGLLEVCQSAPAGEWIYTGALENHPRLVGRIAAIRTLLGNGPQVLQRVRDPWQLARAVAEGGLCCPEIRRSADGLPRDGSWLRKVRRSAGGLHVAVWDGNCPPGDERNDYFQQRVDGLPASAVYVAARGQAVLLGATRQLIGLDWTGARDFRYAGSIGPLDLEARIRQSLADLGNCLAERFGLVGLFGVDFVLNSDGVWPLEVNPRYTASIEVLERVFGWPAIDFHVRACRAAELPRSAELAESPLAVGSSPVVGKAILFASEARTIDAAFVDCAIETNQHSPLPRFADIPTAGSKIKPLWPVMTVFADGSSIPGVLSALRGEAQRL